jgi:hypothetical protein
MAQANGNADNHVMWRGNPVPQAQFWSTFIQWVEVLAQKLPRLQIDEPHAHAIPLHLHAAADPSRRRAVVRGVDLDAAPTIFNPAPSAPPPGWSSLPPGPHNRVD